MYIKYKNYLLPLSLEQDDKMKEDEMNKACSIHVREEKCTQHFGLRAWMERDHLEDLGIDGWLF